MCVDMSVLTCANEHSTVRFKQGKRHVLLNLLIYHASEYELSYNHFSVSLTSHLPSWVAEL